ncbi:MULTISPECIES: hypothetical protein [Corallococcus]|uniref:hypothetical protein n=1 Tax=Corallococcus TaxID=83461 RepID=UPI001F3751E5|nr:MULTISPECIES: hypothetical protein [Corallococcus]
MRTKSSWKRVVTASMLVLAVGCRTPAAGLRGAEVSESGASSQGDSSQSESGNSSQGDSSQGNSSQGDSSQSDSNGSSDEGSSESGSGESSDSDSGNSSHGDSSRSDSNSSGSSDSSDHSSGEGGSSHSGSSEHSNSGSSESNQVDQGDDSRTRSESSNGRENQLLSTATVALTVMGLGIVIWQSYARAERRKGKHRPSPREVGHAAQVYLRARTHQLREDLALGAGPTVEDLAQAARIRRENLDVFGKLLRTHRQELLKLADAKTLTPERARAWLERVGELARTEPRLEEDRQAFLLEQEGAAQTAEALQ